MFRLPPVAYLIVVFLFVGAVPLAFTGSGVREAPLTLGPQTLILLVPIAALLFVARTGTVVSERGLVVRAVLCRRALPWGSVRGLSFVGSSVYAVQADGLVRLPCVGVNAMGALSRASGGRVPALGDARPRVPPARRLRR